MSDSSKSNGHGPRANGNGTLTRVTRELRATSALRAVRFMARASELREGLGKKGLGKKGLGKKGLGKKGLGKKGLGKKAVLTDRFDGEALSFCHRQDALEVELHREPCNEIGTTMLGELEVLSDYISAGAGGARAVIFHSTMEKGFCAGADLRELHDGLLARRKDGAGRLRTATEVRKFLDRIHAAFDAIDMAKLTTISAVSGFCFGGGFELALTTDIIVADKSARFCFPELRLGLIPGFGGIPRLRREVGNAVIRDLLLTGRSVSAARAHELGLVSQVVGRGEALKVARLVAQQAAKFDPRTTAAAKQFVKPLPKDELEREKETFIRLLGDKTVEEALTKFVTSDDVRPYLP